MAYDYGGAYGVVVSSADDELDYHFGLTLEEWARDKPLSILQLDPADRAVLRIAGKHVHVFLQSSQIIRLERIWH